MPFRFPSPVYPIADAGIAGTASAADIVASLLAAGCPLVQLRMKASHTQDFVDAARAVRSLATARGARLIINDRVDIARLVGADGVHLGQSDLPPDKARAILGSGPLIGLSTHNLDQLRASEKHPEIDYVAFGPIFPTGSKIAPDPVQGLDALRKARCLSSRPLVAIGGITTRSVGSVLQAGADAVAVIGALRTAGDAGAAFRGLSEEATHAQHPRRN